MDPAQKKWLKNLIEHIATTYAVSIKDKGLSTTLSLTGTDFLYNLLHLTGLVFGYPERSVFQKHPLSVEWNETDKAKVFFTESLLLCFLSHHAKDIGRRPTTETISSLLADAICAISTFYSHHKPTKKRRFPAGIPTIFKSVSSATSKVEQVINLRLKSVGIIDTDYWHATQYNSFIFLDIIFFREWLNDRENTLYKQESSLQDEIIKIIAVSMTHPPNKNKRAEGNFLKYFLEHAVNRAKFKDLGKTGTKDIPIKTISISESWPDIINLILFEYSIFTVLIDKIHETEEMAYINQIADYLGIESEQKELCILTVSNFIFKNIKNLPYLTSRHKLDMIGSNLSQRLRSIIIKNRGKISREIEESKELVDLLRKARNTHLTSEEKEKVKHQLTDIFLRTIPSVAIFMIPGGTILLPILLKILPEEILMPSSFRNK